MKNIFWLTVFLFVLPGISHSSRAQDLKPDEIVLKHLNAIGSKEKRNELLSLMAIAVSEFESNVPVVKGGGRAIVVSNRDNLFFVMSLNSREYPFEKVGYFNGKINLPFSTAGSRSLLGAFVAEHEKILSDGLFSGVMSLRWPLWDVDKHKPKLTAGGIKKVDDRKAYVLDLNPSGGGSKEFTIKLFFDTQTFNHIRTEYRFEVEPKDAAFGVQNRRASAIVILVEKFSDFKSVDGLMLPHYHRLELSTNGNSGAYQNIWGVRVAEYRLNQALTADFFTFDTK